ncbi:MAG: YfjI family protein [Oscillospiraceae bacterium]|nr:YfjI family protein [Oscillospiraceae bacterium]
MQQFEWKIPVPLVRDKSTLPNFPLEALPTIPHEMVRGISRTTFTDPAMSATAILSVLSHCFSGIYRMEGKLDHTESLNLFTLVFAEPAERKSPMLRHIRKPFDDYITTNPMVRIFADDTTPQALVARLEDNPELLLLSDEMGIFQNFGGRYSGGKPNLDLLLKSWSGEPFHKDRCNAEPIVLQRPYLSICLCGQPFRFADLMGNSDFLNSGLVARFLMCFPKSYIGERRYDTEPIGNEIIKNYSNLIGKLLSKKSAYDGEEILLKFSEQARQRFVEYYNTKIELSLLNRFADCPDWGGKYHGELLRLCGLLHAVECVTNGTEPDEKFVELLTLECAFLIGEYYCEQAIFAYSKSGSNAIIEGRFMFWRS